MCPMSAEQLSEEYDASGRGTRWRLKWCQRALAACDNDIDGARAYLLQHWEEFVRAAHLHAGHSVPVLRGSLGRGVPTTLAPPSHPVFSLLCPASLDRGGPDVGRWRVLWRVPVAGPFRCVRGQHSDLRGECATTACCSCVLCFAVPRSLDMSIRCMA